MKFRYTLTLLLTLSAWGTTQREANAQLTFTPGAGLGRSDNPVGPTVSPYLNLLQTNSQGFIPYQSLVRPQIDQAAALQRQGAALSQLQQQVYSGSPSGGVRGATGHATFFQNFSHFYPAKQRR